LVYRWEDPCWGHCQAWQSSWGGSRIWRWMTVVRRVN
jgi:hypothetical protein